MLVMRERILKIIPGAVEVVSYGMPAFKLDGTVVAGMLSAGLRSLRDLTKWREADIASLHGMGPTAIAALRVALKKRRLSFAKK